MEHFITFLFFALLKISDIARGITPSMSVSLDFSLLPLLISINVECYTPNIYEERRKKSTK
jgi:hypothetical protein